MTDFTEADLRIKAFNDALDVYDHAKKLCDDFARDAQRAADLLRKRAPIPAQRSVAPPPMPNEMRMVRAINFPTEAQINDAIAAINAATVAIVAAWDTLSTKERTRVKPPEELNLQSRRDSN